MLLQLIIFLFKSAKFYKQSWFHQHCF